MPWRGSYEGTTATVVEEKAERMRLGEIAGTQALTMNGPFAGDGRGGAETGKKGSVKVKLKELDHGPRITTLRRGTGHSTKKRDFGPAKGEGTV